MKHREKVAHMRAAYIYADLSYCIKRKVGCVIVEGNRVVSIGYNGTPSGEGNCCEDSEGNTLPSVIHAEDNALRKLDYTNTQMTMFVTTCPCVKCAEKIVGRGISKVVYSEEKNTLSGIDYLIKNGVVVERLDIRRLNANGI